MGAEVLTWAAVDLFGATTRPPHLVMLSTLALASSASALSQAGLLKLSGDGDATALSTEATGMRSSAASLEKRRGTATRGGASPGLSTAEAQQCEWRETCVPGRLWLILQCPLVSSAIANMYF